jgi:hypothetical protein
VPPPNAKRLGAKLGFNNPKSGILQAFRFGSERDTLVVNDLLRTRYISFNVTGINLASILLDERIGDRPSDADGLWCAVRANRSDDLEQPFSNCGPADRVIIVKNRNPDLPWQAIVKVR